jgi:ATP-dependent exoDNAse (exonuclease V) alpha subunit
MIELDPPLSEEQNSVAEQIVDRLRSGEGCALSAPGGSGKTLLIKTVVAMLNQGRTAVEFNAKGGIARINVLVVAPTHAARLVLAARGLQYVTTVHAAITKPTMDEGKIKSKEIQLIDLIAMPIPQDPELAQARHDNIEFLKTEIMELMSFKSTLNPEALASKANYIICDEASMINNKLYSHLRSFGVPVLLVGDIHQLPPVGHNPELSPDHDDAAAFKNAEFTLNKIFRQDEGSGILRLATEIRNIGAGKSWSPFQYKWDANETDVEFCNMPLNSSTIEHFVNADRLIAYTNRNVDRLNRLMREQICIDLEKDHRNRMSVLPTDDEIFVVNRQHEALDLHNGALVKIHRAEFVAGANMVRGYIRRQNGTLIKTPLDKPLQVFIYTGLLNLAFNPAWLNGTTRDRIVFDDRNDIYQNNALVVGFARATTCHKAQGQTLKRVAVLNDMPAHRPEALHWVYTAVTRAKHHLQIISA